MDKQQPVKVVSCGAVPWRVVDGQAQVLLIRQFEHKQAWSIAKGHLKDGESIEECAVREVREETGLNVKLGDRLPDAVVNIKGGTKTVVSFLAEPIGSQEPNIEDPDCEVVEAKWFNVNELPELQHYQRSLIEEAVLEVEREAYEMDPYEG